ncbi:MAG: stage II sporulation protein M [Candidatus Micrarchaeota archaeon]|nr:stage II sporulation protein M [Candidatus Micrarchaeota archaeon]
MVLEHLFPSHRIEKHPWLIAWLAFVFVAIAVSITYYIYPTESGLFTITLVVMPAIPFLLHEVIMGERKQEDLCGHARSITKCYGKLIKFYAYFFVGTALGFAFCSSLLPPSVSDSMFSIQKNEITPFLPMLTFMVTDPSGGVPAGSFLGIFSHNFEVLFLMLAFSFVYSIGSIFLLVWNASLVGVFVENCIRNCVPQFAGYGALAFPMAFVFGMAKGFLMLLPHGIFEVSAFFTASVAGGVLSIAVERRMIGKIDMRDVFIDAGKLIAFSVLLLAIGAFIESSYPSV